MTTEITTPPFDGVRVVEFASGSAGPMAAMMFADYGADVVKVEPPSGDWARGTRGFQMWNRGKRSVVLDLTSNAAEDVELRHALLAAADVVIVGHLTETNDRLHIGWTEVRRINPRAVYCSITGWGAGAATAPKAYDGVVLAKTGRLLGLDVLSGASPSFAGDRPLYSAAPVASYATGQLAFQGSVAALLERERTGRGIRVETNLLNGLITATMRQDFKREQAGVDSSSATSSGATASVQLRGIALTFLTAQCADDKWIQMCARQDHHFRAWLRAINLEELLHDPRYAGGPMRIPTIDDVDEIESIIRRRMREKSHAEWMALFMAHDVGADPFLSFDEFLEHPQLMANDRIVEIADPRLGPVRQLGPLVVSEPAASRIGRPAPGLGEHTAELRSAVQAHGRPTVDPVRCSAQPSSGAPLAGVTVVELATYLAGPLGSTLLAEMGARVIKIEALGGDQFRRVGLQFVHLQHGKESIAVDLKTEQGMRILRQLVAGADMFFHNLRGGAIARLGCDYTSLSKINPSLVYVNAAAYGSKGAEANRTAFHSTPNALCGGGILQAGRGNPPVDDSYPDPCAGTAVASALLLGLYARHRDGVGRYFETTMLCSAGYVHSDNLVSYADAPVRQHVDRGQHGLHALYRLYECASSWLFVAAPRESEWVAFANALGRPEWCADARFNRRSSRLQHDDELADEIGAVLQQRPAGVWEELLVRLGVGAARADGQGFEAALAGSGVLIEDRHSQFGDYWRMPRRVTFDRAPSPRHPSTALGESTVAVLETLGYGAEEILQLSAEGVVFDGR